MKVLEQLSVSLGQRTETANIELAEKIAGKKDFKAVGKLAELLSHKDKRIQGCALKALYETAARIPSLVAPVLPELFPLISGKNNRLIWGAMACLDHITLENPKGIYSNINLISEAMKNGSVITKDHGMKILVKLASQSKWKGEMLDLLLKFLATAPDNQFPTYAELIFSVMTKEHHALFVKILQARLNDISTESKIRNIRKILKKAGID